jgi:hypothetical protein
MKIRDALRKSEMGDTISSPSANMMGQSPLTLVYWLLIDESSDDAEKAENLSKILRAEDWTIDGQEGE